MRTIKKLMTIMLLLCCVITAGAQTEEGKQTLAKAQAGDAEAQWRMGFNYDYGNEGFSKNKSEAVKWYRKSAENGNAEAQNRLGDYYYYGWGILEDENEAIKWYRKAANQGDGSAMFMLGLIYKDINKDEAIYWFKKDMDAWYAKTGKESETSAEELRELGVYYHPSSKSSSTASSSSSGSSSSRSSSSSSGASSSGSSYSPEYGVRDVWVPCYGCNGTGFCSSCHGNGSCVSTWSDGSYNSTYKCPVCYGSGRCQTCYGMRGHNEKQSYQIR